MGVSQQVGVGAAVPAPTAARPPGGRPTQPRSRRGVMVALMLAPSLVLLAVFVLAPLARGIQMSFYTWDGVAAVMDRVWLENYARVWTDPNFLWALARTVLWWAIHLSLAVGGGLLTAALISEIRWRWAQSLFRGLAFLPHVLSLAVVGVVWSQMYHPTIGLLNGVLDRVGLDALVHPWLGEASTALPAVGIASAWQAYGFYMVIFLASIQAIDPALHEAASIDGAGPWQRFRNVTIPALYNTMSLVIVLAFINALKGFGTVWAMTQGGPDRSSELVAVYAYRQAFGLGDVGAASAAGLSLAVIAVLITMLFNRWRDRRASEG
ncbi:carbohydrate ABC transporter permease [Georgenia deserti]|uniref:Carbohydrate ABC transporter permease n=1 Tax=Georgenia deserti TaxID=2093781 RepID=A0ABW4L9I6_9MICO